jgi:hypothetical protein
MSHPPSSFSLTASSRYEWAESTPALGIHHGLSFIFYALLDTYMEDMEVDEGGAEEDLNTWWVIMWKDTVAKWWLGKCGWQDAGTEMQGVEVMWHRKVTWRQKGCCSGRHSGDNNDIGGRNMSNMCHKVSGGGRKEMWHEARVGYTWKVVISGIGKRRCDGKRDEWVEDRCW